MWTNLFLKGALIGFSISMPVGPVGMLCIQHSIRRGLLAGLIAGLGATVADAMYGGLAGFGISLLSHVLTYYQLWFQMIGACLLGAIGIKIFRSKPSSIQADNLSFSYSRIFFSTFALTLTNPFTLIGFAAIYTSLGIDPSEQEIVSTTILTLGISLGAAVWWMLLTSTVTFIGKRFQLSSSPLLNRVSGGILTGCGFLATLSALKQLLVFV